MSPARWFQFGEMTRATSGTSRRAGRPLTLAIAAAASLLLFTATGAAAHPQASYRRCRAEHLSVRGAATGSLPVTKLRVIRISCARAAAAVRAGHYEATPGGPLFSSPGFSCRGPIGPPPPGAGPRYYRCSRGRQRFEFLVPGFS